MTTATFLRRAPLLRTDAAWTTPTYQKYNADGAADGSPVTTGFTLYPEIANDYDVVIPVTINGSYSDHAGVAVFTGINGTEARAVTINKAPTSNAPNIVQAIISRFLLADVPVVPVSHAATITIATPGVFTWAGNTLANGNQITFTTTGALPTGILPLVSYFVVSNAVDGADKFRLALTLGGAAINTTGTQSGVHTVFAGVGYKLRDPIGATTPLRVNTGIWNIPGTNNYAAKLTSSPDVGGGFQRSILWDLG